MVRLTQKLTLFNLKSTALNFFEKKLTYVFEQLLLGAVMRVRAALSFGVHKFFQEEGFHYVNTPIITGSDAEGAGEMFRVSTLDAKTPPLNDTGEIDYQEDFWERNPSHGVWPTGSRNICYGVGGSIYFWSHI